LLWLFFGNGISWTICPGWLWTTILLILAFQGVRFTGMSHWLLACYWFLIICGWRFSFLTSSTSFSTHILPTHPCNPLTFSTSGQINSVSTWWPGEHYLQLYLWLLFSLNAPFPQLFCVLWVYY
jgi:hypothetical protein